MFKECGRQEQVGCFHVLFMTSAQVVVGVAGNSVLFREDSAANGGIVCVRNRGHDALHLLVQPFTLPSAQRWHVALSQIVQTKSVEHNDDSSLRLVVAGVLETKQGFDPAATGKRCCG